MEKNQFFSEKNIYNALVKREFFITYHNCGMQMPKTWDFGSGRNLVPLHSEIGDVHQLAADVDYFFRARMLRTLHSKD